MGVRLGIIGVGGRGGLVFYCSGVIRGEGSFGYVGRNRLTASSKHGDCLPPTVRDAIHLTSKPGLRHLRVDLLCIIQDGKDHAQSQSASMASIYVNTYSTVIYRQGAGSRGTRGFGAPSSNRSWKPGYQVAGFPHFGFQILQKEILTAGNFMS